MSGAICVNGSRHSSQKTESTHTQQRRSAMSSGGRESGTAYEFANSSLPCLTQAALPQNQSENKSETSKFNPKLHGKDRTGSLYTQSALAHFLL
jgi:hypothetical protein